VRTTPHRSRDSVAVGSVQCTYSTMTAQCKQYLYLLQLLIVCVLLSDGQAQVIFKGRCPKQNVVQNFDSSRV